LKIRSAQMFLVYRPEAEIRGEICGKRHPTSDQSTSTPVLHWVCAECRVRSRRSPWCSIRSLIWSWTRVIWSGPSPRRLSLFIIDIHRCVKVDCCKIGKVFSILSIQFRLSFEVPARAIIPWSICLHVNVKIFKHKLLNFKAQINYYTATNLIVHFTQNPSQLIISYCYTCVENPYVTLSAKTCLM